MANRVFIHASQIITNAGVHKNQGRCFSADDLGIILDGALVLSPKGKIEWLGKTADLPKKFLKGAKKIDLKNKNFIGPSLTDCHTHLVYAGNRANELAMRLEGKSYQQIAAAGGGIAKSVTSTRAASEKTLFTEACNTLDAIINLGVGIIEIKSGYGLDWPTEKKLLSVIKKLKSKYKNKLIIQSTFLGAHAFPPGTKTDQEREKYVQEIIKVMIPAVVKEKLADAADVFFDQGYFNLEQSRAILSAAKKAGLKIKIHADELTDCGGSQLAAELSALSADHLLCANIEGLKAMSQANTVAVLLPTTALYLGLPYASIKKMRQANVSMALASDYNPGTSPTFHMPLVLSIACLQMGMQMDEAWAAGTYGGAKALGLQDQHGHLKVGSSPKLSLYHFPDYQCLISQVAHPSPGIVL